MWGHSSCNVSLSQLNVQKNSRALVRGMAGLKFEKNARKTIKFTSKKKLGIKLMDMLLHAQ